MSRAFSLAVAMSICVSTMVAAADGATPASQVRAVLQFKKVSVTAGSNLCSEINLMRIEKNYYTDGSILNDMLTKLDSCNVKVPADGLIVFLFTAAPTIGADGPTLVRVMFRNTGKGLEQVNDARGTTAAIWLYLTRDVCDSVAGELLASKVENPQIAQIGSLMKTLLDKFPLTINQAPLAYTAGGRERGRAAETSNACPELAIGAYLFEAQTNIPYKRGSINEAVYVGRVKRDDAGDVLDENNKKTTDRNQASFGQVTETVTYTSTPLSRFTFDAAAGVFVGPIGGAKQMSIDTKTFVSSPANRAATLAGMTFHHKFDSTAAEASPEEKKGLFVGGVLTPAAGVAAAYSYGWRGFALLFGGGVIWVESAPSNSRLNTAVQNNEALKLRPAYGFLLGGSYAFGSGGS